MEIIEKDFKLKPISESSPYFDLELLYTVNPKKGESREEFKNAGYGLSLGNAVKKIIHYRICNKHQDEAISIKTYFQEYKEGIDNLKELLCLRN